MKPDKLWRQLPAAEYAAKFPRKPPALRKIAYGLRQLGAKGEGNRIASDQQLGAGNQPFTINQWELAKRCGVSKTTLKRYLPLFEAYGILEVKRWRYRKVGPSPNTYRLFLGAVIPEDWTREGGEFTVSPREKGCKES
jgi:hypothetical protein